LNTISRIIFYRGPDDFYRGPAMGPTLTTAGPPPRPDAADQGVNSAFLSNNLFNIMTTLIILKRPKY